MCTWLYLRRLAVVSLLLLAACDRLHVPCELTRTCPAPSPTPEPSVTPTPVPTASATPTATPVPACPPLAEVAVDVLRVADKHSRLTQDGQEGRPYRDGSSGAPAYVLEDTVIMHVTPKMRRPYCPDDRNICELRPECQDAAVGFPRVTQTLPGLFTGDEVVHQSGNSFVLFFNLAPGEVGRYEVTACTEWGTNCTTNYFWAR